MAEEIKVDYEQLSQVAAKFNQNSQNVTQMQQRVQQSMSNLQSGWQGKGSAAFFAEMNGKVLPALRRLIQALAEASRVTKEIGQIVQSAEQQASGPFRGDGVVGGGGGGGGGNGEFGAGSDPFSNLSSLAEQVGTLLNGGTGDGATAGTGSNLGDGFFGGDVGAGSLGDASNGNDMMVPDDWLSGQNDAMNGALGSDLSSNYDDYGIPKDWLSDAMGSGSGMGSGGGGSPTGGGSGGGSPMDSSSGMGSGGGSPTGGGSGGGSPMDSGSGMGSGGGSPTGGGSGSGNGLNQAQPQVKLRYATSGSVGNNDNKAAAVASRRNMAGQMGIPSAPAEQANMGLPLGLAALSPFVALLGKAVKKKNDE